MKFLKLLGSQDLGHGFVQMDVFESPIFQFSFDFFQFLVQKRNFLADFINIYVFSKGVGALLAISRTLQQGFKIKLNDIADF